MNKLAIAAAVVIFAAACGAEPREHQISATCTPSVNVTIPRGSKPARRGAQRSESVQVYWDISRSMRDFAVRKPKGQQDDLTPVVAALDSNVLLQAHARTVEQYGVGDVIVVLPSARPALAPNAPRTVLHLAAQQIGAALSDGTAQAALLISDLELDTPARTSKTPTVCGGVPLPSTPEAGSLFGRCFESAALASDAPALARTNLLVHVFRRSSHGRELFILLFATDRAFGRRISDEIVRRIGFERFVIFDSDAVAAANVRGCRLSAASEEMLQTASGCTVKCYDADAAIRGECEIQRQLSDAWIIPVAAAGNDVTYETVAPKPGDRVERSKASFVIPCSVKPGVFGVSISHSWRVRAQSPQSVSGAFAQKESVRDLFDSLAAAVVRVVAPRTLRIGINVR